MIFEIRPIWDWVKVELKKYRTDPCSQNSTTDRAATRFKTSKTKVLPGFCRFWFCRGGMLVMWLPLVRSCLPKIYGGGSDLGHTSLDFHYFFFIFFRNLCQRWWMQKPRYSNHFKAQSWKVFLWLGKYNKRSDDAPTNQKQLATGETDWRHLKKISFNT